MIHTQLKEYLRIKYYISFIIIQTIDYRFCKDFSHTVLSLISKRCSFIWPKIMWCRYNVHNLINNFVSPPKWNETQFNVPTFSIQLIYPAFSLFIFYIFRNSHNYKYCMHWNTAITATQCNCFSFFLRRRPWVMTHTWIGC